MNDARPMNDPQPPDVRHMTLEDKAAQLFVLRVTGADPDAADLVARYGIGGVIYFAPRSGTPDTPAALAEFAGAVQRAALARPVPIPATIGVDQEGGPVERLPPPFTEMPGAMALAAGRDTGDARDLAAVTARELRAAGFTQNYAPVADVNTDPANPVIGVRSFGADPALAARMAVAQVEGLRDGGVAATAKHFPGHGDTSVDSHTGLPVITRDRAAWERVDLPPFAAAIAAGTDAVMTGHLAVPALDPTGTPATLSHPILTGLLRHRLGFGGAIVTDALDMRGIRDGHDDERIPLLALKAGADVLLSPPNEAFPAQLAAIVRAVRDGELPEDRLDASVRRVLHLKRPLFGAPATDPDAAEAAIGTSAHRDAVRAATERTTTLVADRDAFLPLAPGPRTVLVTGPGPATTRTLADAITERGATVNVHETGPDPAPDSIAQAVSAACGADLVIAATAHAGALRPGDGARGGQAELVEALAATGRPVIVIAVRAPYDIARFPDAPRAYLATYSTAPVALRAAVKTVFGENDPRGRLPVPIPGPGRDAAPLYPFGHGLSYRR